MTYSARIICFAAILGLSACGGGGGGGGSNSGGSAPASYASLIAHHKDFENKYFSGDNPADHMTPVSAMPRSGSATYTGSALFMADDDAIRVAGKARMVADFKGGAITGTVTDFKAGPGDTTTGGNLNVNGVINGNRVDGAVDGIINANGVNHGLDDSIDGVFLENDADTLFLESESTTDKGTDYYLAIATENN